MLDLKACVVCLRSDIKLYNLFRDKLVHDYNFVAGLKRQEGDGLLDYLCVECSAYIRRFKLFRNKCNKAHYTLQMIILKDKQITKMMLDSINTKTIGIAPYLSYVDYNSKVSYEEIKYQNEKNSHLVSNYAEVPVIYEEDGEINTSKQYNGNKQSMKSETEELDNIIAQLKSKSQVEEVSFPEVVDLGSDSADGYFENDFSNIGLEVQDMKSKSKLSQEYATLIPITMNESKAVVDIYKTQIKSKYVCKICARGYGKEDFLKTHMRMHDKHVSGNYECELCKIFYKTPTLLNTHFTEKHKYKYLCHKCPEVTFDRTKAKDHYITQHTEMRRKNNHNGLTTRPSWLNRTGGKRVKGIVRVRPTRKINKLPSDFLKYAPITHEEQYVLIEARKSSKNYLDAAYKCELCYRGFREYDTYNKHMKKHDPKHSGPLQCDICKMQLPNTRKMYKHMTTTHLFKYTCQLCNYMCMNRGQAHSHYKWHKNVTYRCPHCNMEFKKASTHLTHIRIKHPSTFICNLCGHSFVSENGLYCHRRYAHKQEGIDGSTEPAEGAVVEGADSANSLYCAECSVQFVSQAAYDTHLGSSNKHTTTNLSTKPVRRGARTRRAGAEGAEADAGAGAGGRRRGRPRRHARSEHEVLNTGAICATRCELCNKYLGNDVVAQKHYQTEHPGHEFLKRYMCEVCGHTTKQYANLLVHIRTHTREKPYECPHCDRKFSMTSNRDRHLVVHTGEKRYQCQHCNRRFTQSSAVKLHIQTVHLKIPYAPWNKKNRKRRKEAEAAAVPEVPPFLNQTQKLVLDPHADYINAYITYSDE